MDYKKMYEIQEQLLKNIGWSYVGGSLGNKKPSLIHTNGDIAQGIPAEMIIDKMYDDFKNGGTIHELFGSQAGTLLEHRSQMEKWEKLGLLNNLEELKPGLTPIDKKKRKNYMEEKLTKEELIYQLGIQLEELEAENGPPSMGLTVRMKVYKDMIKELKGTLIDGFKTATWERTSGKPDNKGKQI